MSDLHGQIMNLPCVPAVVSASRDSLTAYRIGHRDARHAAAELAIAKDIEIESLRQRVKELEVSEARLLVAFVGKNEELAALKQGQEGKVSARFAWLLDQLYFRLGLGDLMLSSARPPELIALEALDRVLQGRGEPVAVTTIGQLEAMNNGYSRFITARDPAFANIIESGDDVQLYTSVPTIPAGWQLVNSQALLEAMAMFVPHDCYAEMDAMLAAAPKQRD